MPRSCPLSRRLGAGLLVALLLPGTAPAATYLDQVRTLRDEGRLEDALNAAEEGLAKQPADADLLLLKGQILGYLDRYDEALRALAAAEAVAPLYDDVHRAQTRVRLEQARTAKEAQAKLALPENDPQAMDLLDARLSYDNGLFEEAQAAYRRVLADAPDNGGAWLGLGDAAKAGGDIDSSRVAYETALGIPGVQDAATGRLRALVQEHWTWLVNLSGTFSLAAGGDPWAEGFASVTRRLNGDRLLGGSLQAARRFDDTDLHLAGSVTQRFSPTTAGFLSLGLTPDADFLPDWRLRAGVEQRLHAGSGYVGATIGFVEGTLAGYEGGTHKALTLGATHYTVSGTTWGTLRVTGGLGFDGESDIGFGLRLDHQFTRETRGYVGYGHARDEARRGTTTSDSVYVGLRHDVSDHLSLDALLAHEVPQRGDTRQSATLGLVYRFE